MYTRALLFLLIICLAAPATAQKSSAPQKGNEDIWRSWRNKNKLIVVTTSSWNAIQGRLTRYDRRGLGWMKIGEPIPVVVGRAGMAWDPTLVRRHPGRYSGPIKREGDARSPAGIFQLKAGGFGFADALPGARLYMSLTPTTECVDDPQSRYYARIVDRSKVDQVDWKSSEKMSLVPQYRWGVVVNYNMDRPVRGDGSCIFLHQWSGPSSGTAGCTAMSPEEIEDLVHWIKDEAHAVLVQLPRPEYQQRRAQWQLPAMD